MTWSSFTGYSEGYSSAGSYLHEQLSAKENKVIQLNGEVAELRRKVFDLEEALSEKEQVRAMTSFFPNYYNLCRSFLHEQLLLVLPLPAWQRKVATPWTSWRTPAKSWQGCRTRGLVSSSCGGGRERRRGSRWRRQLPELRQLKKLPKDKLAEEKSWRARVAN